MPTMTNTKGKESAHSSVSEDLLESILGENRAGLEQCKHFMKSIEKAHSVLAAANERGRAELSEHKSYTAKLQHEMSKTKETITSLESALAKSVEENAAMKIENEELRQRMETFKANAKALHDAREQHNDFVLRSAQFRKENVAKLKQHEEMVRQMAEALLPISSSTSTQGAQAAQA